MRVSVDMKFKRPHEDAAAYLGEVSLSHWWAAGSRFTSVCDGNRLPSSYEAIILGEKDTCPGGEG